MILVIINLYLLIFLSLSFLNLKNKKIEKFVSNDTKSLLFSFIETSIILIISSFLFLYITNIYLLFYFYILFEKYLVYILRINILKMYSKLFEILNTRDLDRKPLDLYRFTLFKNIIELFGFDFFISFSKIKYKLKLIICLIILISLFCTKNILILLFFFIFSLNIRFFYFSEVMDFGSLNIYRSEKIVLLLPGKKKIENYKRSIIEPNKKIKITRCLFWGVDYLFESEGLNILSKQDLF